MSDEHQKTNLPILIRPCAAAKILDCSRGYIYKMLKSKLLPAVSWEINGRQMIRIHPDDLADFIESHRTKQDA